MKPKWGSPEHRANQSARATKHGWYGTPEYRVWQHIKDRTGNPKAPAYRLYGARGIQVCERWRASFTDFLKDMGPRPAGYSIERINNDGHYEPGNCKWATAKEQTRNCNRNRFLTFAGKCLVITDWAKILNIGVSTLRDRLDLMKWPLEKALTTPPFNRGQKRKTELRPE